MKVNSLASVVLVLVALLFVTPSSAGQNAAAQKNQPGGGFATPPIQIRVMGCLKRNAENGGYYLKDQNGHIWELVSSKVDLAGQVNHSVAINGKPAALSNPPEMQQESGQETQTGGNHSTELRVLTLQMLSPSCTR